MTMDIKQTRINLKMPSVVSENGGNSDPQITKLDNFRGKSTMKRSFDVAFLMMPDDKMKAKQAKRHSQVIDVEGDSESEDLTVKTPSPELSYPFPRSRFYDSSSLLQHDLPRSAFQKVMSDSPVPPPLSPDQMSCPSQSPPISISPNGSQNFRYEYPFSQQHDFVQQNCNKLKQMMYRPSPETDISSLQNPYLTAGPQFIHSFGSVASGPPMIPEIEGIVRGPAAAALLSTFLPTTLSLPAQNVCAKCNISFRMTSDLVYHMRSHHKNDYNHDPNRRKREEKLKCPVCSESFRERHHLTRHMTAHQDKAGDLLETKKGSSRLSNV